MTLTRKITSTLAGVFAVAVLAVGIGQSAPVHKTHALNAKPVAHISVSQANAAALQAFPGKITGKTKLENENGIQQYSVTVLSGRKTHEVMVNAKTGKVAAPEASVAAHKYAKRPMQMKSPAVNKIKSHSVK